MSTLEKLKTRGHWIVRIYPAVPLSAAPTLGDLDRIVRESAVTVRGWDFPHYDYKVSPHRFPDHIEQQLEWQHHNEIWRAYRSGQFVSASALWGDWRDKSGLWPPERHWKPGATLGVEDAIFRFVEIYEFAARWAQRLELSEPITVECTLRGLEGRALELSPRRGGFFREYVSRVPEWSRTSAYGLAGLVANPRDNAIPPAISLLELFGWDISQDVVRDIQHELRG